MIRKNDTTNQAERKCRKCGRPILLIQERIYRTIQVDAEIVYVIPKEGGKTYIRPDGSKMIGTETGDRAAAEEFTEHVFRPHAYTCRGGGAK